MRRSQVDGLSPLEVAVAEFGRAVEQKLRPGDGSSEDHIRGPFDRLLTKIGRDLGLKVTTVGETRLPDLSIRPDYAVDVDGTRVGYVELKRPGHGVPDTWPHPSDHDKRQWQQFKLLPNVLYSDGEHFAHFSNGVLQGKVGRLAPALRYAGGRLHVVDSDFERTITDFLIWTPPRPRSLDDLVRMIARLCRLLRDDVLSELERERTRVSPSHTFTALATDWRQMLFPNLTDAAFADQYAQTVTFALLLARVEGVGFEGRAISEIARLLGKKHSLMGRALAVLTDQAEDDHSVALTTMTRVISVVDWADYPDDSYAMLYERFLERYDPELRRKSGVYFTPAPLVGFMTGFVDEILRTRLGRKIGFAAPDVIVVDPAMGTGSFLASVVDTVAARVAATEGPGAVGPRLRALSDRLIGFENQAAPYAVAELRLHSLLRKRHRADLPAKDQRFLADTLDDPSAQILPLGSMYQAIARSRRDANEVKQRSPVMVVIGNPPYVDKVKGLSPWIETPSERRLAPTLSAFKQAGNGRREYVLSNTYVYFWRWATWKVFDAHADKPDGVVAFVCSAGFTTGSGFAGMREYLRRTADEGWIVDLSPEGHQPPMATRFFRGNQQPICVAVFVRRGPSDPSVPARVHYRAVTGTVEEKVEQLASTHPDDAGWEECVSGWTEPFRVAHSTIWRTMPAMPDLMPWTTPGIKPNRTWVYAPSPAILRTRWDSLRHASAPDRAQKLKETRDLTIDSQVSSVLGMEPHHGQIRSESGNCPPLRKIAHRSFDSKWMIPDARLIDFPRPPLWAVADGQV